jgi:ABC-type nitrate/sulfonate/bicarbonate transport system substrate-binding protein
VARVAAGGADFCLTSVTHYLFARAAAPELAARFVSVVVQRSPISGLVAASSALVSPADLAGRRLGGQPDNKLVKELQGGLADLGLAPATLVPMDYGEAPAALGRGETDVVADFVDLVPRTRRQAGIPVRAVNLGLDVYASGLVAADRLPADTVTRMQDALAGALERQRVDPKAGLEELARRYPDADPLDAVEGWSLAEPQIFTGVPAGSWTPERWRATIDHVARVHGLPAPAADTVYRPDAFRPSWPSP